MVLDNATTAIPLSILRLKVQALNHVHILPFTRLASTTYTASHTLGRDRDLDVACNGHTTFTCN
jgi:hypothetical protein